MHCKNYYKQLKLEKHTLAEMLNIDLHRSHSQQAINSNSLTKQDVSGSSRFMGCGILWLKAAIISCCP